MKRAYLVQSSVIIMIFCIATAIVSAQTSNQTAFSIPSFNIPAAAMNPSAYGVSMPDVGGSYGYPVMSGASTPDSTASSTASSSTNSTPASTPSSSTKATASSPQVMSMPNLGLPNMQSPSFLAQLLSSGQAPQTDTVAAVDPNNTTTVYTLADNNKTVNLTVNGTFRVELPFRVEQGGVWNLTATNGLNVSGQSTSSPNTSMNPNTGKLALTAIQEWDIKAISPGEQKVHAICSGTNQTFDLIVKVS